ncbi:MAG TPA: allophanate hydrolase subunit 1 [Gemmataceae bacterium]|jgi:inhibitor of KinA|nr:allophanate hydrolase subunit 1 [Gemmataceae bacterium]
MNPPSKPNSRPVFQPLGDQAVLAYLQDEKNAQAFAATIRNSDFTWLVDVVPAYASVGVYFDSGRIGSKEVRKALTQLRIAKRIDSIGRTHVIPCCYEFQLDLARVAEHTSLSADQVIEAHTAQPYTAHAIGFCPGFPYLGYLPKKLTGVPRLPTPRLRVEPGSVGLTGRQTGVYPLARPGGWNIIGRTPLELVNVADGYFPLRVGDRIQFQRIDDREYEHLKGNRLPT